jgi:hypothetical protein
MVAELLRGYRNPKTRGCGARARWGAGTGGGTGAAVVFPKIESGLEILDLGFQPNIFSDDVAVGLGEFVCKTKNTSREKCRIGLPKRSHEYYTGHRHLHCNDQVPRVS